MNSDQVPCLSPKAHRVKFHKKGSEAARACASLAAKRATVESWGSGGGSALPVPSAVPASERSVVRQSRAAAEHLIYETLESVEWGALAQSQIPVQLVYRGVRHPDYVGSAGTSPALERDLAGLSGIPTSERYARHLAKRGWYVDVDSKPEFIRESTYSPERHLDDVRSLAPALRASLVDCMEPYSERTDWDALPEVLIGNGVTNPDFEGRDVDPTPALERELDALYDAHREAGVDRESEFGRTMLVKDLAKNGWHAR